MALKKIIQGEEYRDINPNEIIDNHQFVDLGLRSHLLWSVLNIGAIKISDTGSKFVWGGIVPKKTSEKWLEYRFVTKYLPTLEHYTRFPILLNPTREEIQNRDEVAKLQLEDYAREHIAKYTLTTKDDGFAPKYSFAKPTIWCDNKKTLELNDDAAHCIWGGRWRMPTLAEFEELISSCEWDWCDYENIRCLKVIGHNGNGIYFPMPYTSDKYWSSTLDDKDEHDAFCLSANSNEIEMMRTSRTLINYIRPVLKK